MTLKLGVLSVVCLNRQPPLPNTQSSGATTYVGEKAEDEQDRKQSQSPQNRARIHLEAEMMRSHLC